MQVSLSKQLGPRAREKDNLFSRSLVTLENISMELGNNALIGDFREQGS